MVQNNFQVQGFPQFEQRCHTQFLYSTINPNILNTHYILRIKNYTVLKNLFVYNVLVQQGTPFLFLTDLQHAYVFFKFNKINSFALQRILKFQKKMFKKISYHYSEIPTLNFFTYFLTFPLMCICVTEMGYYSITFLLCKESFYSRNSYYPHGTLSTQWERQM